jgi:hypothetical protein
MRPSDIRVAPILLSGLLHSMLNLDSNIKYHEKNSDFFNSTCVSADRMQ